MAKMFHAKHLRHPFAGKSWAISRMLTVTTRKHNNSGDCCCETCEPIQALVSGLAHKQRLSRMLAMLQVYVDESGRGQESGAYVAAGFIASVETWLEFSRDWQIVRDEPPALAYFKTKEAMGMGGSPFEQFRGWTS